MTRFVFMLVSCCLTTVTASASETESAKLPLPPEYYVAEVPGLRTVGEHRLSWGFLRPPHLWYQGQLFDLRKIEWPQWDSSQFPAVLPPPSSPNAELRFFDANKRLLLARPFNKPLAADEFVTATEKPAFYQIVVDLRPARARLGSKLFPWTERRVVVECSSEGKDGENPQQDRRMIACLEGLRGMGEATSRPSFAIIHWPRAKSREAQRFIASSERELRSVFRKNGHFLIGHRTEEPTFRAQAGITNAGDLAKHDFDPSIFTTAEFLTTPPSLEEKTAVIHENSRDSGEFIRVFASAGDSIADRAIRSPPELDPGVHLQFVKTDAATSSLRRTEFREVRTGLGGAFRSWSVTTFATTNQLSSNRGEKTSMTTLPGLDLAYHGGLFGLTPAVIFDTGTVHPGSDLTVSELLVTARRAFPWSGPLQLSVGFEQYSLSGKNPGSSRLGKMDALAAGFVTQVPYEDYLLGARAHALIASSLGFESRVEIGRRLNWKTDLKPYVGFSLGFARYAGSVENRLQFVETFTEDRLSAGIHLGFIGADFFSE